MSNFVPEVSRDVKFIHECIATLDEYDIDSLAHEISGKTDDELAGKLHEEACVVREVYGGSTLVRAVTEEFRRDQERDEQPEQENPDRYNPNFPGNLNIDRCER